MKYKLDVARDDTDEDYNQITVDIEAVKGETA
jgi:hypothetical protein